MSAASRKWTMVFKPNPQARMRLFCVPYAGAGACAYRDWPALVRDDVELIAVQLPGRENRFSEPLLTSIDEIVAQLIPVFCGFSDKPFVLFGHSMGALISFELTRALQARRGPLPRHLVVSGAGAPGCPRRSEPIHRLDSAAFLEKIKHFNGTPKALLQDAELMQLFTPLLRADFGVVETYRYEDRGAIGCPVTALGGDCDDTVRLDDLRAWPTVCRSACEHRVFSGDHFFIYNHKAAIVELINRVFDSSIRTPVSPARSAPAAAAGVPVVEEGMI